MNVIPLATISPPADERERGYDARMRKEPLRVEDSSEFKAGWMEADYESCGDENVEF